jgi:phosphatidylinositol alpha-mannosyltransferase
MRIAMYHSRLPTPGRKPGGAEVYVHRLAVALAERGHEVVVYRYSGPSDGHVPYGQKPLRPAWFGDSKLLRQYGTSLRMNAWPLDGFDVLHTFGDDWFFRRRRIPTVRTFLGAAVFEAATATSRKRKLDQLVLAGLEQVAARLATAAFGIGLESQALAGKDGILDSGIAQQPPRSDKELADAPTILFVGTWAGRKRGALLHDVFTREIRLAVPGARLVMVSDDAAPAPGVELLREPTNERLTALYREAWVFCLPSAYEGFGLPYLEAMSHGVPTVSTPNLGAVRILGGGGGALVEESRLGAELVALLKDAGARERLGSAGRTRAKDFSWDRVVDDHERAYTLARERFSRTR